MTIPHVAIDLIKGFEGCELRAYQDSVGVWTIGFGHTIGVKPGMTLTQQGAEHLLAVDLQSYASDLLRVVKVPLNPNQFSALLSFIYNLGVGNLRKSTLLKHLNQGKFDLAAEEFLRWDKVRINNKTKTLRGLTRRRQAEKVLFLTPVGD